MFDAVEIFKELLAIRDGDLLPDLLEDELVAIGYDAGQERCVEERDIVFFVGWLLLWQKARAASSTLAKVACLSNLSSSGITNFSPLYSILTDCSMGMRGSCRKRSRLQADWHSPIVSI